MTTEIQAQLRDYAEHVTSHSRPADFDEVVSADRLPLSPGPLPRGRRGWRIAVAAAALVLFVGLLLVVASGLGDERAPVITEPAPTPSITTPAEATTTPTAPSTTLTEPDAAPLPAPPAADVPADVWEAAVLEETVFPLGSTVHSLTWGGPGLVAGGVISGEDGDETVVWTSGDGLDWVKSAHHFEVGARMDDAVAGGPGVVLVGQIYAAENLIAAVWTSVDGRSWTRVPHDDAVFGSANGDGAFMTDVVAGPGGLVAAGFTCPNQRCVSGTAQATVWSSRDGLAWTRSAVFSPSVWINELIVTETGYLAAGNDNASAAVWTSDDATSWRRVPNDGLVFGTAGGEITAAVSRDGLIVAFGYDKAGTTGFPPVSVWTSTDGTKWNQVPDDNQAFATPATFIPSAVAGGPGLVAVGETGPSHKAAIWISSDGTDWQLLQGEPIGDTATESGIGFVTTGGPGLTAIGWQIHGAGNFEIAGWVTPPIG